jgi:general secretion pathway protein J
VKRRGFTLIEVLVAMAVMAILAGLAWRGVDGMLRARAATDASLAQSTRLATVMAQWEQDLQSIFDAGELPRAMAFDGQTLRLVRRGTGGGVLLVAWSLREGRLMRWSAPETRVGSELTEQWLRSQQLLGNEAAQQVLLEGVLEWQLVYYVAGTRSNPQSTGQLALSPAAPAAPPGAAQPDSAASAVLPRAAREQPPQGVELTLRLASGPVRRVVQVVPRG